MGSEKGEGSEPRADKGSARRGDNCSHYLELRPKPSLQPGRGAVAKWMEMDGGALSPRRRVRPGAITVPPGWTQCLPPWPWRAGPLATSAARAIRSFARAITRLDINNSPALVYICLTPWTRGKPWLRVAKLHFSLGGKKWGFKTANSRLLLCPPLARILAYLGIHFVSRPINSLPQRPVSPGLCLGRWFQASWAFQVT